MKTKPSGGKKLSKKALKNMALLFFLGFAPVGQPSFGFGLSLDIIFFVFLVLLFFDEKMWTNKKMMKKVCQEKKKTTYVLQGCPWRDVLWKNLRLFALWWHFGSRSLARSVVERLHVNFSAHPCPLQRMVLWPVRPSVIKGPTQ